MIATAPAPGDEGIRIAAGLTSATFGVIGLLALTWGGGNAITGRALRQHRSWSRVSALTLGVINLLILPFGTALGVYTLWVLMHDDARNLARDGSPGAR
jgi:hypothetical protein